MSKVKIQATKELKFDAGHRVVNHESKCRTLHGHEYKAHVFAEADGLDAIGRVVDFSVISDVVGAWLDEHWDHNMIIWKNDPNLPLIEQCEGLKKPFITEFNPTAENMASYLLTEICPKLLAGTGVVVTKIRLYETSKCYVDVCLD